MDAFIVVQWSEEGPVLAELEALSLRLTTDQRQELTDCAQDVSAER
jgi:hypothetical protein